MEYECGNWLLGPLVGVLALLVSVPMPLLVRRANDRQDVRFMRLYAGVMLAGLLLASPLTPASFTWQATLWALAAVQLSTLLYRPAGTRPSDF